MEGLGRSVPAALTGLLGELPTGLARLALLMRFKGEQ
jgi:hypothetical protein